LINFVSAHCQCPQIEFELQIDMIDEFGAFHLPWGLIIMYMDNSVCINLLLLLLPDL
jgi:hypothetical protein